MEKNVCAYISPVAGAPEVPAERRATREGAVANLQRSREPFVGRRTCGQSGESSVEHRWMHWKRASNRLFLLSFFEALPVHEKGLAKRGRPYYAWCSSGTSTQDIVDFDLERNPRARPGRPQMPRGKAAAGHIATATKATAARKRFFEIDEKFFSTLAPKQTGKRFPTKRDRRCPQKVNARDRASALREMT